LALRARLGSWDSRQKRGAEFYAKLQNAKGGILEGYRAADRGHRRQSRQLRAQGAGMVERRDCRLLTGITLSSEALAVCPSSPMGFDLHFVG